MQRVFKRSLIFVGASAVAIGALLAFNLVLGPPHYSINDLSLRWIVSPGRYFVPVPGGDGLVETNPELVHLDNQSVRFFPRKKATYRIFCIGGSTTQGWPFHHFFSYPKLLGAILTNVLPGRRIEVINAGFLASDSTSDLPLVNEIMRYHPDLLLVYEGRNEWWNSSLHHGFKSRILKLYIWLVRNFSVCGWLSQALYPTRTFNQSEPFRHWADFEPSLSGVDAGLTANLKGMETLAHAHHCRMVVMTQVFYNSDEWENSWFIPINRAIRSFSRDSSGQVDLIDVERAFQNDRRGSSLLIPPPLVHPEPAGYFLMALTVAHGLYRDGLAAPQSAWRWSRLKRRHSYFKELGVTSADIAKPYGRLAAAFRAMGKPKIAAVYKRKAALAKSRGLAAF